MSWIKTWHDNDVIDEVSYKGLICTSDNLPRCYELPKIHKTDFPLRIIVSAIGSPLYNVVSFLNDILSMSSNILSMSIPKPISHINDNWSLVGIVDGVKVEKEEILISLDATSLFTNIPKKLVLDSIKNDRTTSRKS